MVKNKVPCPHCGAICKEGTGLKTHLRQWCKKVPGNTKVDSPGAPASVSSPDIEPPEAPQDPPKMASQETGPPISEPRRDPAPEGGDNLGDILPPPGPGDYIEAEIIPPPGDAAPLIDVKKDGPLIVAIIGGIIIIIAAIYLMSRRRKKAQARGQVINALQDWQRGQAQDGRQFEAYYPPGGGY